VPDGFRNLGGNAPSGLKIFDELLTLEDWGELIELMQDIPPERTAATAFGSQVALGSGSH
jgi:hypothetical protein